MNLPTLPWNLMADSFPPAIVSAKLLSAVGFYWQGDRREPTHLENQNKNQPEIQTQTLVVWTVIPYMNPMGYIHLPLRLYSNNSHPGKQQKYPVLLPFSERCWILRSPIASLRGGGTCKQLTWTTKPRQWELQRYSHYLKRGKKTTPFEHTIQQIQSGQIRI